jgi:hypothetical protein
MTPILRIVLNTDDMVCYETRYEPYGPIERVYCSTDEYDKKLACIRILEMIDPAKRDEVEKLLDEIIAIAWRQGSDDAHEEY